MKKTILRRLEALEIEESFRIQEERSSLSCASVYLRDIVFAYHLGGLASDESDTIEAYARALNYPSWNDCLDTLWGNPSECLERWNDAWRRLFAQRGLDFDKAPPTILFDAFVTMVDQLPEQWLKWLKHELWQWAPSLPEIPPGTNVPSQLSPDILFGGRFGRRGGCSGDLGDPRDAKS